MAAGDLGQNLLLLGLLVPAENVSRVFTNEPRMHLLWLWHRWAWEYRALGRRGSRAGGSRPRWVSLVLAAPNPRWGRGLRPPGVTVCCRLPIGSRESLFSCALTASEEAMAALEEVILHAFQQCVYYVSKVRRAAGSLPRGGGCSSWRPHPGWGWDTWKKTGSRPATARGFGALMAASVPSRAGSQLLNLLLASPLSWRRPAVQGPWCWRAGAVLGEPMGLRRLSRAALCSVAPSCAEPGVEEDTASVSRASGEKPPVHVPRGPSGDARGP